MDLIPNEFWEYFEWCEVSIEHNGPNEPIEHNGPIGTNGNILQNLHIYIGPMGHIISELTFSEGVFKSPVGVWSTQGGSIGCPSNMCMSIGHVLWIDNCMCHVHCASDRTPMDLYWTWDVLKNPSDSAHSRPICPLCPMRSSGPLCPFNWIDCSYFFHWVNIRKIPRFTKVWWLSPLYTLKTAQWTSYGHIQWLWTWSVDTLCPFNHFNPMDNVHWV